MAKTSICIPHWYRGEFDNLSSAMEFFIARKEDISVRLENIVAYNVFYRDILRAKGTDALLAVMADQTPVLKEFPKELESLRKWCEGFVLEIAQYDIQCINIHDRFTVLGQEFNGLDDVKKHFRNKTSKIAITLFSKDYPTFDSFDSCDDRSYDNFAFSKAPLSADEYQARRNLPIGINYCMVTEKIPQHCLPILYYVGDFDYMLLATAKE